MILTTLKTQAMEILGSVTPYLLKATHICIMWFSPIHLTIGLVLLAISIDTVAGRWAAKQIAIREGKVVREVVTSRATRKGFISKSIQYITLLILTFFADRILLDDLVRYFVPTLSTTFLATKLLGFIFILIEFDSFDEKYYRVKGVRIKTTIKNKLKKIKSFISKARDTMT